MTVTEEDMTVDFILEERARELAGEWQRRLDLKRLGKLIERVKLYNPDAVDNIQDYHVFVRSRSRSSTVCPTGRPWDRTKATINRVHSNRR